MKTKIQIESISGDILFEYENENATIKDAVEQAVREHVNLSEAKLYEANLSKANLSGAILTRADLCEAVLYKADLSGANLHEAKLHEADLRRARLSKANLCKTDLYGVNLYGANLYKANLCKADICEANLYGVNLYKAYCYGTKFHQTNLCEAYLRKVESLLHLPLVCPSDGAFIGWKQVDHHLIKLLIPKDAKRSSATTNSCRCNKAKVLAITDLDGSNPIKEIENTSQQHHVVYRVGEMVYPDSFDEDRWNECSHGIHFFINKIEAINY